MNSGVVTYFTKGRVLNNIGTHQKLDKTAFRITSPYMNHQYFPTRNQILKFEGMGGPDGLKFKGKYTSDHLWDPINKIGYLPVWIEIHYQNLVEALKQKDYVKAAFEAGFMAHYLTDSLTPAHHVSNKLLTAEYENASKARLGWLYFGRKGIMSSHVMFESGVSMTVGLNRLRVKFDEDLYSKIQDQGIIKVVEEESLRIAKLDLYNKFLKNGWSAGLAKTVKTVVAKRIPQLIGAAWLSAYKDSGHSPKPTNLDGQVQPH